jgi:hypothetical protein
MSMSRKAATIRTIVGIAWTAFSQVGSRPAMRAPRMGRRGARPTQKKMRNGPRPRRARSGSRRIRLEAFEKMKPVRAAS